MTTTNILKLITALIITTILIVGFGVVEIGAQEAQEAGATKADIENLKNNIGTRFTTIYWIIGVAASVLVVFLTLIAGWVFVLHGRVSGIREVFNNMTAKVRIDTLGASVNTDFFESKSPRKLTRMGDLVLQYSGGQEYLIKHKDELFKEGKFDTIDTPWGVHRRALDILLKRQQNDNDKEFNDINKYIYNKGIPFNVIIEIMSIKFRDMVLEKKKAQIKETEKQKVTKK